MQKDMHGQLFIKIRFSKAYDMVGWDCLKEVLRARGFGPHWQAWIDIWLKSAKVQVLANSLNGKEIVCKRGLQQGDLLSPSMFVLVVDRLNKMLKRAKEVGWIQGLLGSISSSFTNFQYADDMLIFDKCHFRQACVIKCILVCFETWSRLKINFHKSSLICLGRRTLATLII